MKEKALFYHLFTLVAKLTSKELAGRIANSTPRKRYIVWVNDAAISWLSDNFDYCRLCYEFVIGEEDPQTHATCLADCRRETEEERLLNEALLALEDERVRDELEERVWQVYVEEEEEEWRVYLEATIQQDLELTYFPNLDDDYEEPEECPGGCGELERNCVCAELASLRRYNATPLEERCGPWTA